MKFFGSQLELLIYTFLINSRLFDFRFAELAELMFSKSKNDFSEEESQGRQSGSLAWRLSRAETELESSKTIVIKPKPLEEESMIIDILFDITKDIYIRKSNGDEQISGWSNLAFEVDNMLKKEELDWNMVYLARKGNLFEIYYFTVHLFAISYQIMPIKLKMHWHIYEPFYRFLFKLWHKINIFNDKNIAKKAQKHFCAGFASTYVSLFVSYLEKICAM